MIRISDQLLHRAAAALFVLAIPTALWRAPTVSPPAFVTPPSVKADHPAPGAIVRGTLPVAAPVAGASSLTQLADGRLALAWLSGPEDDESSAAIWLSILGRDGWSTPQPILNRERVAAATFMHINKLGRPVLHAEGGWLHLWGEALPLANWAGGSIVRATSTDGGKNWARIERLPTAPFGGLGNGLGSQPAALADGGLGLPVDTRLAGGSSAWLRLTATGQIVNKTRLAHDHTNLQPAVAAIDEQHALAIVRERSGEAGRATLRTADGGQGWQASGRADLPNPDAPVALIRLGSGRLLLAGNPPQGREALLLWISDDQGNTWQQAATIEAAADGGAEFAFPALLQSRDGRIHLSYTARRQAIRHASFNEAWLTGAKP